MKTLTAGTLLFLIIGCNFTQYEETNFLSNLQHDLAASAPAQKSGSNPFNMGGDRTIGEAFESGSFTYGGSRF